MSKPQYQKTSQAEREPDAAQCCSEPGLNPFTIRGRDVKTNELEAAKWLGSLLDPVQPAPPPIEIPVEPFPVDVLPGPARKLVEEGAVSLGCAPDLIALPALVAMATAIGTQRKIEIKSDWHEPASIYGAVVADPGCSKTPAMSLALDPLHRLQSEALERHWETVRRCNGQEPPPEANDSAEEDAVEEVSSPASGLSEEKPVTKADGKNSAPNPGRERRQQKKKQKKSNPPVPPPQFITTDTTTEALGLLLNQNPRGIGAVHDELTHFTGGHNRYRGGKGADRAFYQMAWNGTRIVINRIRLVKGARMLDTTRIENPCLSVIGGIQPDMMGEISDESGREDGFIHRFAFCYPDRVTRRPASEGVRDETRQNYYDLIRRLLRLPMPLWRPVVSLTEEALDLWNGFMSAQAAELTALGFPAHLRGPWRKLDAYRARFALTLQLSRYASGEADDMSVDAVSVNGAERLVVYFKSHARKVYERLRNEPSNERAATLLEWITALGGTATLRDVVTAKVAGCRNSGEALAMFERMAKARIGKIHTHKNPSGGRASISFEIHKWD